MFHIILCGIISHPEEDYKDCSSRNIIVKFWESRKYDYRMLIRPLLSGIFQVTQQIGSSQEPSVIANFPDHEQGGGSKFVNEHHHAQNVGEKQPFSMGFAWTIPLEKVMFSLFTTIIYADATMDTKSEGDPLLSLAGKDTCSKTFMTRRVVLPNQQLWVFWQ